MAKMKEKKKKVVLKQTQLKPQVQWFCFKSMSDRRGWWSPGQRVPDARSAHGRRRFPEAPGFKTKSGEGLVTEMPLRMPGTCEKTSGLVK